MDEYNRAGDSLVTPRSLSPEVREHSRHVLNVQDFTLLVSIVVSVVTLTVASVELMQGRESSYKRWNLARLPGQVPSWNGHSPVRGCIR